MYLLFFPIQVDAMHTYLASLVAIYLGTFPSQFTHRDSLSLFNSFSIFCYMVEKSFNDLLMAQVML